MNTLNRYIFRELFTLLGILLLVFTFVISLWHIPFFSELVFLGVPLHQVLKLISYMAPPLLTLSLPPAALAASAMAYSRLSSDGEITAMKAAGQSLYKLLIPPLVLGGIALTAMFYLTLFAKPWGVNAFRKEAFKMINSNVSLKLKEGVFIKDFDGFVIYIDDILPKTGTLRGIMVTDYRGGKNPRSIFASEGRILRDPEAFKITLRLKGGSIHSSSAQGNKYHLLTFAENDLSLDVDKALATSKKKLELRTNYDIRGIKKKLRAMSKKHEFYYPTLVQYYKMFSTPFAALLFALIGATMGIGNRRLGRSGGFVLSIVIAFAYYNMMIAGERLGGESKIPPLLAVWFPTLVLGGYCLFSIPRVNREVSTGAADFIATLIKSRVRRRRGHRG